MSEYDNTNSGIIWEPHADQQFKGQGKINVDGNDYKAVLIKEPLKRDGDPVLNLYVRMGPLFPNDRKDNDRSPDLSGPCDTHPGKRIAGWRRQKDGRHYLSLAVSQRDQQGNGQQSQGQSQQGGYNGHADDDEIPF